MIDEKDTVKRKHKLSLWEKIMLFITLLLLLVTIFCVILFVRINEHERKLDMLIEYMEAELATVSGNNDVAGVYATEPSGEGVSAEDMSEAGTAADSTQPDVEAVREAEEESASEAEETAEVYSRYSEEQIEEALEQGRKVVYLTFDDGPSDNTDAILDILNEYGVKASFFVVGKDAYKYGSMYKRIAEEGHTIAMHSYSHVYSDIYSSVEAFDEDFNKISCLIELLTGIVPEIYRFPGGSSNLVSDVPMTDFIRYLNDRGILYFDWNVSSEDSKNELLTVEQIVENIFNDIAKEEVCVVLMHDASELTTTVEALPVILERLQEMDAVILPITENTGLIQHIDSTTVK